MNVWVYTGYTFEELLVLAEKNEIYMKALEQIDVLVDGKFVMDLKSFDVQFRGSSNQRILDVKKSLEKKLAVKISKYK
jgi:anaerobic ribonucleoside-triphosphate reductase activating protein